MCRFVAGVIRRERLQRFEQVLWRACRGNVFVQQAEIEDPLEDPATVSHCVDALLNTAYIHTYVHISCSAVYHDIGDSPA